MDILTGLTQTHKRIAETPVMYQKIMTNVNFIDVVEYVKNLDELFQEVILPHFDYEETQIFPGVSAKGSINLNNLVEVLLQEHKQITEKLNQVKEMSKKLWADPAASQRDKDKLISLCTAITRELIEHGQKEDDKLFPLLRDSV